MSFLFTFARRNANTGPHRRPALHCHHKIIL